MNILDFSELRLMDDYRAQTDALARIDRWYCILRLADVSENEATAILADVAGEPEAMERAA
jgi:hypothetical protein